MGRKLQAKKEAQLGAHGGNSFEDLSDHGDSSLDDDEDDQFLQRALNEVTQQELTDAEIERALNEYKAQETDIEAERRRTIDQAVTECRVQLAALSGVGGQTPPPPPMPACEASCSGQCRRGRRFGGHSSLR